MGMLLQDIRYGIRMLWKSPGFAAIAILTLALGIGANTAIFSLIDGILMRALPVRDAESLVVLKWAANKVPERHSSSSYGDCAENYMAGGAATSCSFSEPFFHQVAARVDAFSGVEAFAYAGPLDLSGNGTASVLRGQAVSGGFFPLLGIRAAAGRLIEPSDDSATAAPVVVLNYSYWESQFGGSPAAIGKTIRLNDVPFTIIGVADARFDSLSPGRVYDVWVPLSVLPQVSPRPWIKSRPTDIYDWWLVIIGRLKPGVARQQAQTEASTLFREDMLNGPKPLSKPADNPRVEALPAQSGLTGEKTGISTVLYVLMAAVGLILLIACANVAGLLLSRATARLKEMAVRQALGAGRRRLVRQLLTESILLSVAGGAAGILFALWATRALVSLMASNSDRAFGFHPGIDVRVLAFTLAATVLTGVVFGLAPAFRGIRVNLTPALKEGARGSAAEGRAGAGWFSLGHGLVVAQVALAVVVLAGAGLLVRTLRNLKNVDPGFDTRNLVTFDIDPTLIGYKTPQVDSLYRNLQQRLASLPGVEAVSYSSSTLLSGNLWTTGFHLAGTPKDQESDADHLTVGAEFFSTMRIPLLAGRNFTSADFAVAEVAQENLAARQAEQAAREAGIASPAAAGTAGPNGAAKPQAAPTSAASEAPVPVIVNRAFVEKYFPKRNPLGLRFGESEADPEKGEVGQPGWRIVAVAGNAKYEDMRGTFDPTMYVPSSGGFGSFELRTKASPAAITAALRGVVSQLDPNLPILNVHTQTELIDRMLFQERMTARLAGFFGVLALALACLGLYGLLSYEVSRRTREIGIRMALGAYPADILKLVVREGIVLAMVGLAAGIGAALGMTRFLGTLLYQVRAKDPATMAGVAVLLTLVALLACYVPARRATRVDPMVTLRHE